MKPTAEEISANYDFTGKVALITGATNGLGLESARVMALRNCKILLGCRTMEKGVEAKNQILAKIGNDKADLIEPIELDLSTLANVRNFATQFQSRKDKRVHILMNNAAANSVHKKYTTDGFEENFGINHLAPFLLTLLMIPILRETANQSGIPARIVNVASGVHFMLQSVDYDDYNSEKVSRENPVTVYAISKLANLLCSRELNERLQQTYPGGKIVSNSLTPPVVFTGLGDRALGKEGARQFAEVLAKEHKLQFFSIEEGTATQVFVAGDEEAGKSGGLYYRDCAPTSASALGEDRELQKKVWALSEKLVGLTFEQAVSV